METKGNDFKGTVDRSMEEYEPDGCITVTLDNGFKVDYWMKGLPDEEYLHRTNIIYRLENNQS